MRILRTDKCANRHSNVIKEIIILFLVCLLIVFSFYLPYLNEDNCSYAIEEMHAYDNQLFQNSINIVGAEYSPKYIANEIMAFLVNMLGNDWLDVAVILIRINYFLYAVAATCLTLKIVKRNHILVGIVISICLMRGSLISLGFTINGAPDVFLGMAIPLALIAIAYVIGEKKQWSVAWLFLSLATFTHIHEGLWAGTVIGIIWLSLCIADKKIYWKALRMLPIL